MIESFRHRGLRRLFEDDDRSRLPAEHVGRLRIILSALDAAEQAEDLDIHTFRQCALDQFHPDCAGRKWSSRLFGRMIHTL